MPNRTVAVELKALVSNYVAGMKQAAQATQNLTSKAGKALQDHSAEVSQLGTTFALTGGAMLLAAGKAVKTYADFDKAMSGVAATGADAKASLGDLRAEAIKLGADTQFSATEAAQGITNLMKAGIQAKDVISGALAGSLNLAAAGQMDVADAAETTAVALQQFKMRGDQASHVADLLAAGAGKAMGEVSDLAMALRQGGLVANQTGLSIEETTGALSAFAAAGLLGSDAGTSLKTMLQRLTPQSAESQKQFDKLGISAYDAQGNFVGLANFAGQLQTKMRDLSPEARNAAMSVMFGSDAVRAANVLYTEGADGIQGWIDAVNDQGYAARQAAELTNNLAGDLERLSGSIDTVFIQSGSGANDVLRRMAQGANALVDAVGRLPGPLLSTVTMLVGSGGLVTLGVGGVLKLASAAADASRNFKTLGVSAKTAKLAVGGIGAAIAIGTIALSAWADAQAQAEQRAQDFASTLVVVNGQVTTTDATLSSFNEALTNTKLGFFGLFGDTAQDVMTRFGVSVKDAQGYLIGNADAVDRVKQAIADYGKTAEGSRDQLAGLYSREIIQFLDQQAAGLSEAERRTLQKAEADEAAGVSSSNLSTALQKQETQADGAADAINQVTEAIYGMQDANISVTNSEVGFEQAIDDSAAAVKKLIKATKDKSDAQRYGKDLQDLDNQAGRDAMTILTGLASKTSEHVKTLIKQGKSEDEITGAMSRGRKAFADRARDLGYEEDQIADLIATYMQVPENVTTNVNEEGAGGAKRRVDDLMEAIKDLPKSKQTDILSKFNNKGIEAAERALAKVKGKDVPITPKLTTKELNVRLRVEARNIPKDSADGNLFGAGLAGLIQQFASGGFGQPQVRPFQGAAGVNWGEQGSGPWEAFISGAPQKRDRSIAIWREVGRRLLGRFTAEDVLQGFADGGIAEPVWKGKPLSYWQDQLRSPLELTRLQIQIRDLKKDLAEKETYNPPGRRKKAKRDKLRGLDRTEAKQDLAETEEELRLARLADQLNRSKQGTIEQQIAAYEARKEAAERAAEEAEREAQAAEQVASSAAAASQRWQQQYMTGSSAADLLANMQAGAQQIAGFNDLLGQLDSAGLSDQMMAWLWDQGPSASEIAKQILTDGMVSSFNAISGNLSKASDAAGQSQATGAWVRSPVLTNVNLPGYMQSGVNGSVVNNKTVNFNITQSDPYAVAVAVDQQLRYL